MSRTSLKTVLLCVVLLAFGVASAYADNFTFLTSRVGTTTLDWGQFGPPFTTHSSPWSWTSGGFSGTASDLGTLERRDEGNGWDGIFAIGDHLLWNQDNGQAIDIHFNTPISLGGAQIQDDFFGLFMGCVQAMTPSGSSPVFCTSGNNDGSERNTAPFVGIQDTTGANITDLLFTTDVGPNATAINQLTFTAGGTTPEPTSMLLLGSGLLTAAAAVRRRKRQL